MTPEVIGDRYRVQRALGHGGMGSVWLCTDTLLGREVAVKQVGLLPGESAPDFARALREARSSAHLNHRNVVSVFDIVEDDGALWMVMEFVPARTLAQLVREHGRLPPATAADLGAQVADGLAAAHAAGVIHRDVKPDNILVTDDGVAKIGDFGIARSLGDEPLTQTGLVTGTPAYFSPELAEGGDPGPESDVWALGATLYAAVEGTPPFPRRNNAVAMVRTIASQPPARPQHAGFLEPALSRLLDRNPASRWTMADAAHALRRLADRHHESTLASTIASCLDTGPGTRPSAAAGTEAGDPPVPEQRPRRRIPWLPAAALVALLAAAAIGYLALGSVSSSPQAGSAPTTPDRSRPATPSGSPSPSPTPTPSLTPTPKPSPTPTPTSTPTHHSGPSASRPPASVTAFLRDYYRVAPQDQDAGWARLGPDERRVGRSSYDHFWQSLDHVEVNRVSPAGTSAIVDLTYHFDDGRVVRERQRIDLLHRGGGYLIDHDTVLGSRTVSS